MNPWSSRRKIIYLAIAFIFFVFLIVLPVVYFLYRTPTCFDGKKNGNETGVDCGGTCQLLCSFEGLDPIVVWSRPFKVAEGVYSAAAYIQNPNPNSETWISYVFKLYDANNTLIGSRENRTFIPKNKVLAVFEQNINTEAKVPVRATFELTKQPVWRKTAELQPEFAVVQKSMAGETTKPRIEAMIENKSKQSVNQIEVIALVYNQAGNAIAASRTFVDRLDKDQSARIVFTWLLPFSTEESKASLVEIIPRAIPES